MFWQISLGDSFGENHVPKPTYDFTAKENNVNKVVLLNETKLQNQLNYQNEGTEIEI